jgi:hypothetical protein
MERDWIQSDLYIVWKVTIRRRESAAHEVWHHWLAVDSCCVLSLCCLCCAAIIITVISQLKYFVGVKVPAFTFPYQVHHYKHKHM